MITSTALQTNSDIATLKSKINNQKTKTKKTCKRDDKNDIIRD